MAGHLFLMLMFYAYILESVDTRGEFYRGHTDDLKRRVAEHNDGKCPHTSKSKPWQVKFYAAFETLALARDFEKYLKSGSGHAFANHHFFHSAK
jgi:putative endonuclease